MYKRGVSTIVVSIILVVLALAIITTVWFVIRGLISQGAEDIETGISRFTLNLGIIKAYESAEKIIVEVTRKSGAGTLLGIKFILSDGTSTEVINKDTNMEEFATENFELDLSSMNAENVERVSIAAIFASSSGSKTTGSILDTYEIKAGTGGNGNNGNGGDGGAGCVPACSGNTPHCVDLGCVECRDINDCPLGTVSCTNGVCVEENCPDEPIDNTCTVSEIRWECGTRINNCGKEIVCGNCQAGYSCDSAGKCLSDLILTGVVGSVWPAEAPKYFDSDELPSDGSESDLILKYINFQNSPEAGCIRILRAEYVYDSGPPAYAKTHLQLERVASIQQGNGYSIWRIDNCGAS